MHEEDVMWKWPPDLSWELLLWGMAEVVSLCGNLTVPYALADCTSRSARWQITQKRCSFEARLRLFLRKVRILESRIHADSGAKSPPSTFYGSEKHLTGRCGGIKRMPCFTVPGRSGWSAPINMHYNLAQGVIWKGNPTTSWCCSFHGNFPVIFFFFFISPHLKPKHARRTGNVFLHLLWHSQKKRINTLTYWSQTHFLQCWLSIW